MLQSTRVTRVGLGLWALWRRLTHQIGGGSMGWHVHMDYIPPNTAACLTLSQLCRTQSLLSPPSTQDLTREGKHKQSGEDQSGQVIRLVSDVVQVILLRSHWLNGSRGVLRLAGAGQVGGVALCVILVLHHHCTPPLLLPLPLRLLVPPFLPLPSPPPPDLPLLLQCPHALVLVLHPLHFPIEVEQLLHHLLDLYLSVQLLLHLWPELAHALCPVGVVRLLLFPEHSQPLGDVAGLALSELQDGGQVSLLGTALPQADQEGLWQGEDVHVVAQVNPRHAGEAARILGQKNINAQLSKPCHQLSLNKLLQTIYAEGGFFSVPTCGVEILWVVLAVMCSCYSSSWDYLLFTLCTRNHFNITNISTTLGSSLLTNLNFLVLYMLIKNLWFIPRTGGGKSYTILYYYTSL